jgi:hypothetical protein
MNRFAWDLRYNEPIQIPGAFYSTNGPRGPLALPGDYQVKLTANGKTQTATLHLVIDPRTKDHEAELPKQFELSTQVTARISELHQAVNEIRDVKSQIKALHTKVRRRSKGKTSARCGRWDGTQNVRRRATIDSGEHEGIGRKPRVSKHAE